MPRRAYPSATLSATVRARLGLTRAELGLLLGVGVAQVGHVETGYRNYSAAAQARLRRLASLVPAAPAPPETPATPPAGPTPAEAAALHRRQREFRHQVARLRARQAAAPPQAAALAQRRQALATLGAALAAPAPTPPDPVADGAREAAWLELLHLGTRRRQQRQPSPTALGWQALRLQLLEAELAGLAQLLAGA